MHLLTHVLVYMISLNITTQVLCLPYFYNRKAPAVSYTVRKSYGLRLSSIHATHISYSVHLSVVSIFDGHQLAPLQRRQFRQFVVAKLIFWQLQISGNNEVWVWECFCSQRRLHQIPRVLNSDKERRARIIISVFYWGSNSYFLQKGKLNNKGYLFTDYGKYMERKFS